MLSHVFWSQVEYKIVCFISVALVSGVSTIGTSVTIVGLPISASLAIVRTVSTCVGACLLLTSRKYKNKLLKCYELLDKITTS